jgi:hypothetical protein
VCLAKRDVRVTYKQTGLHLVAVDYTLLWSAIVRWVPNCTVAPPSGDRKHGVTRGSSVVEAWREFTRHRQKTCGANPALIDKVLVHSSSKNGKALDSKGARTCENAGRQLMRSLSLQVLVHNLALKVLVHNLTLKVL